MDKIDVSFSFAELELLCNLVGSLNPKHAKEFEFENNVYDLYYKILDSFPSDKKPKEHMNTTLIVLKDDGIL